MRCPWGSFASCLKPQECERNLLIPSSSRNATESDKITNSRTAIYVDVWTCRETKQSGNMHSYCSTTQLCFESLAALLESWHYKVNQFHNVMICRLPTLTRSFTVHQLSFRCQQLHHITLALCLFSLYIVHSFDRRLELRST